MNYISKTDYVLWRECPKNAWLKLHRPDVYNATGFTEFEQSVIDAGIEAEGVARRLFPEGILIAGSKTEARQKTVDLLITAKPEPCSSRFLRKTAYSPQLMSCSSMMRLAPMRSTKSNPPHALKSNIFMT